MINEENGMVYKVGSHDISWAVRRRLLVLVWFVLMVVTIGVMC